MRSRRLRLAPATVAGLVLAAVLVPGHAGAASPISVSEPCAPGAGVTVIVDFQRLGARDVQLRCAPTPGGESITGLEALQRAGFAPAGTDRWGLSFICRLLGLPAASGPDAESCAHTPPSESYWSYWQARPSGVWTYSGLGATASTAAPGSVEGWSFSTDDGRTAAPRVAPQDATGIGFVLGQPAAADAADAAARAWVVGALASRAARPRSPIAGLSPTEFLDWVAGGRPVGAAAPYAARFTGATPLLAAGESLDHPRFPASGRAIGELMIAAVAGGQDPRALVPAPDPRTLLLARIGDDGVLRSAQLGTPDELGAAPALAALALTGGAPPAFAAWAATQTLAVSAESATDTAWLARTGEYLATAQAAGTAGLGGAIDHVAALLVDRQAASGAIARLGEPSVLATARAARTLALLRRDRAAAAARGWVLRHAITPELARRGADGGPLDVGAFAPTEDHLRDWVVNDLPEVERTSSALEVSLAALAALAPATPPAPLPPRAGPPVTGVEPAPAPPTLPAPGPTPAPILPAPAPAPAPTLPAPAPAPLRDAGPRPAPPAVAFMAKPRLRTLARRGRLTLRVAAAPRGTAVHLLVPARDARSLRLRLRSKRRTGWIPLRRAAKLPVSGGDRRVTMRLPAAQRRALRSRSRPLRLRVELRAGGERRAVTSVTLRR